MVVFLGFAQPDEWIGMAGVYARHALRFEAASEQPCVVVPFWHSGPALVERLRPSCLVLSGFCRSFQQYDAAAFRPVADMLDGAPGVPTLALCGAHQLLGFHFDGRLRASDRLYDEPMRRRRPGEPIVDAHYHPDYYMERGFFELDLHGDDPLFAGCADPPVVCESHYCEVKALPPGFRLLASTPECRIQAMRHVERPLIGLQFHPEEYTDALADGRVILTNFFREAAQRGTLIA